MSDYKFQPGDIFLMKPKARVKWLAFSIGDGGIQSIRCDTPIGLQLLAWIKTKSESDKPAYNEVRKYCVGYWPHHLETAVKVEMPK